MSSVHTNLRTDAHGYTRSKSPWILKDYKAAYSKLIHYLSGGGIRSCGRTVGQEESRYKHIRFLVNASIIGLIWLILYVF